MTKEILQQALDALTRLSFLGNGDFPGNSEGNRIAQKAVADIKQALAQQEQPSKTERQIRRMFCVTYASDSSPYMDDGEAQDNSRHPCIDFLRDSPEQIQSKMVERAIAKHKAQQEQPASVDAYVGAREDAAIWKKRALEAEELNRKFIAEVNGPTYLGEPVQPAQGLYPLPDNLYPGSKDWMAGSYKERVEWLHGMYESAKQEVERLEAQQAQEPVMYQYRWLNPGDNPDQPESELEWKLVEVRNVYTDTIANRIDELRGYRFSGKPVYEVRPLYAAPPTQPALSDDEILNCFYASKSEGMGSYMLAVGRAIEAYCRGGAGK